MVKDDYNVTINAKDIESANIIDDLYEVVLAQ
jgi:hypothetical protein